MSLLDEKEKIKEKKKLYFDCSHGVGYYVLKEFIKEGAGNYFDINIINDLECDPMDLNKLCGAEHVHKNKSPPKNLPGGDCVGLSIDGDADRIVYFMRKNEHFEVIDGDKIIILLVECITKIFREIC